MPETIQWIIGIAVALLMAYIWVISSPISERKSQREAEKARVRREASDSPRGIGAPLASHPNSPVAHKERQRPSTVLTDEQKDERVAEHRSRRGLSTVKSHN